MNPSKPHSVPSAPAVAATGAQPYTGSIDGEEQTTTGAPGAGPSAHVTPPARMAGRREAREGEPFGVPHPGE